MAGLTLVSMGGVIPLIARAGPQQTATPDRLLGRMRATVRLVQWGSMPLAGLFGGALGAALGAPAVLWIGAAGMTAAFLPLCCRRCAVPVRCRRRRRCDSG
ncbi:hypothetical protein QLQ12_36255 [Actinoplanes sp. NEAU-A12]|uniref:Major facilitator superfamily (MFS) profile domain-containing protein n=1 Tax=Actinoplanes sandaracinus TaxID=3045177 RepID=A0ABT6WWD2_9ACTN|nr:hypothetical protein [Actinoplanes sandaracinus]MDI6104058.1 hypothetical protein [Actinoplanes sandaracinus]